MRKALLWAVAPAAARRLVSMTAANSRSEPNICISKNKSHCHCIIVWHRGNSAYGSSAAILCAFKEAPAAAQKGFSLK